MDFAVPIVGSPRLAPFDLLLWQAQLDSIVENRDWNNGNYEKNPARAADAEFGALMLTTPENYNKVTTRKQVFERLSKAKNENGFDSNDKIRTIQAMMSLDISEAFGGSLAEAAKTIRARLFVIVSKTDHVVTPGPALELAGILKSKVLELDNPCGHGAMNCDQSRVNAAIGEFLAKQ